MALSNSSDTLEGGRIRMVDPSEDSRWDEFVSGHPDATLYCGSAWMRLLRCAFPDFTCRSLALEGTAGGPFRAVLPLYQVPWGFGSSRLVSVPMATMGNPLAGNEQDVTTLLHAAVALAQACGAPRVDIQATTPIPAAGFQARQSHVEHYLPLEPGLDSLFRSFDGGCVRNRIRKAGRSGLAWRLGATPSDLHVFYRLYLATRRRLGLPVMQEAFFKAEWDVLRPSGHLELLMADLRGETQACLWVLKWRHRVSADILAYRPEALVSCANHFVLWKAIERAVVEGFQVFDFGRTPVWETSLLAFKDHWGTRVRNLVQLRFQSATAIRRRPPKPSPGEPFPHEPLTRSEPGWGQGLANPPNGSRVRDGSVETVEPSLMYRALRVVLRRAPPTWCSRLSSLYYHRFA